MYTYRTVHTPINRMFWDDSNLEILGLYLHLNLRLVALYNSNNLLRIAILDNLYSHLRCLQGLIILFQ